MNSDLNLAELSELNSNEHTKNQPVVSESQKSLVDEIVQQTHGRKTNPIHGVVIGEFIEFDENGKCLVDFPLNPLDQPIPAMSVNDGSQFSECTDVALSFVNSDPFQPIILGPINHSGGSDSLQSDSVQSQDEETTSPIGKVLPKLGDSDVYVDGKKIVFDAEEEIVIKCGNSSITLTKAGKILIRGKYLLNRSSGVNRIKGGSVQIN